MNNLYKIKIKIDKSFYVEMLKKYALKVFLYLIIMYNYCYNF